MKKTMFSVFFSIACVNAANQSSCEGNTPPTQLPRFVSYDPKKDGPRDQTQLPWHLRSFYGENPLNRNSALPTVNDRALCPNTLYSNPGKLPS